MNYKVNPDSLSAVFMVPSQIVDNIKAIENISFTSDELERIDKISLT